MARLERPVQKSTNPATKFLEWKSDDKCFSYYDKSKGEKVKVELPIRVLFMEHYHTVRGWHDPSQSGIFANEVFLVGSEELNVRSFKGGEIAKGLYKEIKPDVNAAGGDYHRSIYVMLEDGSLANISLKGASIGGVKKEKAKDKKDHPGYSDFYRENENKLDYHWIEIVGAVEAKSGRVEYSIPKFKIGERISDDTDALANEAAATLQAYMKDRFKEDNAFGERTNSAVDKFHDKKAEDLVPDDDLDNLEF